MKIYRRLWVTICATLTTAGLSLGLVFAPVPMTLLAIFFGALAAMGTWVWLVQNEDAKGPPRARSRVMTHSALIVGGAIGAVIGFGVLLGTGVLLLLIVVLAISPYAIRAYGRWLLAVPTPSTAQLDTIARALAVRKP